MLDAASVGADKGPYQAVVTTGEGRTEWPVPQLSGWLGPMRGEYPGEPGQAVFAHTSFSDTCLPLSVFSYIL